MIPTRPLLVAAAVALAAACSDSPTGIAFDEPVDLRQPWATASPAEVGMDAEALARAARQASEIDRFRSLLVVRRGRLVGEYHFGGMRPDDMADVRSVTKSVVSTLVGLALERGHLRSLDQTLGEVLGDDFPDLDEIDRQVTVRHLLTMSGGWAWTEQGAVGYNDWLLSGDHVGYLLRTPRAAPPGGAFAYNSAGSHLLGVVVEKAVGRPLGDFAREALFAPLGIDTVVWEPLGGGPVNGSSGLDLRPRDLARLGQLFLQDGWSGRTRVLPSGWVGEATRERWPWRSPTGPTVTTYGYQWWIDVPNRAFMAWGFGGQFIYVAPERELVVVVTTEWRNAAPADLAMQALSVIVEGVLPAAPEG